MLRSEASLRVVPFMTLRVWSKLLMKLEQVLRWEHIRWRGMLNAKFCTWWLPLLLDLHGSEDAVAWHTRVRNNSILPSGWWKRKRAFSYTYRNCCTTMGLLSCRTESKFHNSPKSFRPSQDRGQYPPAWCLSSLKSPEWTRLQRCERNGGRSKVTDRGLHIGV